MRGNYIVMDKINPSLHPPPMKPELSPLHSSKRFGSFLLSYNLMGYFWEAHICQCLNRISSLRRDSPVTIFGNRRKTGKQFVENVIGLAEGLREIGLRRGDVVAIAAINSDLYLEWLLAVTYVGAIAAPLNYRWVGESFEEARLAIEVVTPVMLAVDESCSFWSLKLQNNNLDFLRWHAFLGDHSSLHSSTGNVLTTETLKKPSQISKQLDYTWAPEGIALICFTSGTTGRPKGVAITHTALIVQSLAKIAIVGYNEDDVYLHTAPLCHIGGISSGMAMLMTGACHVLIPKFEVESALKAIEQHHVSALITVPAMMADLVSSTRKHKAWIGGHHVKKILNGGGGLSVELINNAAKIFPCAKLLSAYGMTETCSSLTFMILYDPRGKKFEEPLQKICESKLSVINNVGGVCVGKPAPHVELQIHRYGSSLTGRILTRGPHVMLRYWDQDPAAVSKFEEEGWLDTGDIGWVDDYGAVWLIGRLNGQIKSGGENVYPEEVEAVLRQHPGVSSAVVVGLPDSRLTEMVAACIHIKEEWQWNDQVTGREDLRLSSDILQLHCKQRNLTRFKIPKIFILWRKPFPLTTTGKLRRDEVRRQVIAHLQLLPSHL